MESLDPSERGFVERAIRRRKLFLILSVAGIVVAAGLGVYYGYRRLTDPAYPIGVRSVLLLLVLLNARQNLRQYRYAGLLSKLGGPR